MKPNSVNSAQDEHYFSADEMESIKNIYQEALDKAKLKTKTFRTFKYYSYIVALLSMIIIALAVSALSKLVNAFSLIIRIISINMFSTESIRIYSAVWLGLLELVMGIYLLLKIKNMLTGFNNGTKMFKIDNITFLENQDYANLKITQMVRIDEYLILYIKNFKLIQSSNEYTRFIILRKTDNPKLDSNVSANFKRNILKKPRSKMWRNIMYIDATTENLNEAKQK